MKDLYLISGTVVSGDKYGTKLGYPTANIDSEENIPTGIYGGTVTRDKNNEDYRAGIVVGAQNTTNPPKIEAHLIDFSGDLYGEKLTLHLKKYIREIRNYSSETDLKKEIEKDIKQIRTLTF